jgi:hypothetical protein
MNPEQFLSAYEIADLKVQCLQIAANRGVAINQLQHEAELLFKWLIAEYTELFKSLGSKSQTNGDHENGNDARVDKSSTGCRAKTANLL